MLVEVVVSVFGINIGTQYQKTYIIASLLILFFPPFSGVTEVEMGRKSVQW